MPDTTTLPLPPCPRDDCTATTGHCHVLTTGKPYPCFLQVGGSCTGHQSDRNYNTTRCYAPRTATPAPQPIDPADVRVGDKVRAVATLSVTEVLSCAIGGTMDDGAAIWLHTGDSGVTCYLLDRPDPDAPLVGAIARVIASGAGARALLDALRAEYVIEPKAVQS